MAKPAAGEWIVDEFRGIRDFGIDRVVSLLEAMEQEDVGLADEVSLCRQHGMRYTSFPIADRDVPQHRSDALALIETLHSHIVTGEHIVVHCRAGIGRTGMIACALLMRAGRSAAEALQEVSLARGTPVPDTAEQIEWIRSLEPDLATTR